MPWWKEQRQARSACPRWLAVPRDRPAGRARRSNVEPSWSNPADGVRAHRRAHKPVPLTKGAGRQSRRRTLTLRSGMGSRVYYARVIAGRIRATDCVYVLQPVDTGVGPRGRDPALDQRCEVTAGGLSGRPREHLHWPSGCRGPSCPCHSRAAANRGSPRRRLPCHVCGGWPIRGRAGRPWPPGVRGG